ncbi:histidine kinase dimerization/phospho-acceptor domain-containing protein [Pseudocolwellia sp. HL-MZ7]|uniref:sensor histidine kinase n=1 Tax=Pseudocolwellia sp. HL-MZ7 TaxID=3400627 RepID=UPI003CEB62E7
MKNKNSLQYQFKKQLALSIGLLVIVFSFLLYQIFLISIGSTMHRTMMSMAGHYAKQVERDANFVLPNDDTYSVYLGKENIPEDIATLFDFDTMKDYGFSVNDGGKVIKTSKADKVVFIVKHPIRNNSQRLYLLYDDSPKRRGPPHKAGFAPPHGSDLPPPPRLERPEGAPPHFGPELPKPGPFLNVPISIVFVTLLAILLVYGVARRLIKTVLEPLSELTVMAKSLDENNPELSFEVVNNKTEIGEVAKTLHQTMDRIHQYHQREKQFLQNASHELRTPIAVVSSSLDIIDLRTSQGNTNIFDQHTNIRRANKNMAELTNALLLLSRKDGTNMGLDAVNLKQLSTIITDEHSYLLKGKNVNFKIRGDDDSSHELPKALCRIALSNLIRNAFEHTSAGIVNVEISGLSVLITNSSSGLTDGYNNAGDEQTCQGFGIGLDIVRKIVEQQGWQLALSSDKHKGSQVIISFEEKGQLG